MKKALLLMALSLGLGACTTASKALKTIPPEPTHKLISINSHPSGAAVDMEVKYLGITPLEANIPLKYNFIAGKKFDDTRQKTSEASTIYFKFVKSGYETLEFEYKPTISFTQNTPMVPFNKCKNYNGTLQPVIYSFPEGVFAEMQPLPNMTSVDTTIPAGESGVEVSRNAPGASGLEKTIIRWFFDSEPRGARVFWRVISSIPAQVKNTNESYLGSTPFEETRSFNILGLTYENSRDVQIEIKITKPGYVDQTKRFNVRQAIDQMEISSFYDLVPAE